MRHEYPRDKIGRDCSRIDDGSRRAANRLAGVSLPMSQRMMLRELLPVSVAFHETRHELETLNYSIEREAVRNAVDARRAEFLTARECARRGLRDLGVPPGPIARGRNGEPQWPIGIVGSITHCAGYRAAAVARQKDVTAIGIDAEPHAPMDPSVFTIVSTPKEIDAQARLRAQCRKIHWDRLLFCAKEAVYKAWFPDHHLWLDFHDVVVLLRRNGTFTAEVSPVGNPITSAAIMDGKWSVRQGIAMAAIALPVEVATPKKQTSESVNPTNPTV